MSPTKRGRRQTLETRAKISAKQQQRLAEIRELGHPPRKRCSKCGRVKNTATDFYWYSRPLVSGDISSHPRPDCKACQKKRIDAYKKTLGSERLRKDDKRYYKNRRRRLAESKKPPRNTLRVKTGPIVKLFEQHLEETGESLDGFGERALGDKGPRTLRRIRKQSTVTVANVLAILRALGSEDAYSRIYPQGSEKPRSNTLYTRDKDPAPAGFRTIWCDNGAHPWHAQKLWRGRYPDSCPIHSQITA